MVGLIDGKSIGHYKRGWYLRCVSCLFRSRACVSLSFIWPFLGVVGWLLMLVVGVALPKRGEKKQKIPRKMQV